MAPLMPKWHLLVLLGLLDSCKTQLVPRSTFAIGSPGRAVTHFSSPGIENTTTLLLSNDNTTLYVGARDSVLSLDVSEPGVMKLRSKVDWSPTAQEVNLCTTKGKNKMDCHNFVRVLQSLNSTHLYACGTFAFSPKCSYMNVETFSDSSVRAQDGQGRCPFDPFHRNTAVTADGELYVGTVENFLGNKPAISRFLSRRGRTDLKLDGSPGWLTDPTFVGSSFIPSEGKVYFFFTETSKEYNFVNDYTVSRVAQVCVNDEGGKLVLQKHWTTFAKAELRCQAGKDLPLNIIQDIFTLPPAEGTPADDTLLYGVFSSQWPMVSGQSAVCRFKLGDIKEVFAGSYYKLNQQDSSRWETPQPSAKIANPGECGMHAAADDKLNFVRSNFLTQRSVTPVGKGPVLVSPDQLYSRIAALRTQAANGRNFTVLFLLTESGFLHKVVLLDKGPHIIEEIQVFQQPQSVKNILLSISKGVVFVASSEGMVQVPVSSCSSYSNCAECVLARDPFCGWDPDRASCVELSTILHGAVQDVEQGNAAEVCEALQSSASPCSSTFPVEERSVQLDKVVRLACPRASRQAAVSWQGPDGSLPTDLYLQLGDGSLSFLATRRTQGMYCCLATENGYTQTLTVISVRASAASLLSSVQGPTLSLTIVFIYLTLI